MKIWWGLLALGMATPAWAATDMYPVLETVSTFKAAPLTPATVARIEADFELRKPEIAKRHAARLKGTDVGYGAKFRAHYVIQGGSVDYYSGIEDGWLHEVHCAPMPVADAVRFIKAAQAAKPVGAVLVSFAKPSHQDRKSIVYESTEPGCSTSYTLLLDAKGRCVEIDEGGGC